MLLMKQLRDQLLFWPVLLGSPTPLLMLGKTEGRRRRYGEEPSDAVDLRTGQRGCRKGWAEWRGLGRRVRATRWRDRPNNIY